MGVHVGPALGVSGDAAEQRDDFCLFIEFDLFLPEAALDIAPPEGRLVDGAHPGEMTVADVVSSANSVMPDMISSPLVKFDPEGAATFAEIGHLHAGRQPLSGAGPSWPYPVGCRRLAGRLRWLLRAEAAPAKTAMLVMTISASSEDDVVTRFM